MNAFNARCPLMTEEAFPNLSDDARSCDIPAMQMIFQSDHPGRSCSEGGCCIVHKLYPKDADTEIHLQNIAAEEARKNRALFRKSYGK